ncbi:hypothetical protein V3C99_012614 [Haemonchus contortus]
MSSDKEEMEVNDDTLPDTRDSETPSAETPVVDETLSCPLPSLISNISCQLDKLRQEAMMKEKIADEARNAVKVVEDQLRTLLHGSTMSPGKSTSTMEAVPTVEVSTSAVEPAEKTEDERTHFSMANRSVEKGKCKFACNSSTHQFATECDVFPTLSDRRDRMRQLKICFNCFQLRIEANHEAKCIRVVCYYCSIHRRLGQVEHHVSALCPYMFPQ